MDDLDPTVTDPDNYKTIFENDRVRVLDYRDTPGAKTKPHRHPNSVLLTLSDFRRRLTVGDDVKESLWKQDERSGGLLKSIRARTLGPPIHTSSS